jgi:hypothetical protein
MSKVKEKKAEEFLPVEEMSEEEKAELMEKEPKSIWQKLSIINVNKHTEVKGSGNFTATYLSWSWAWGILMEHYPDATFENHLNQDGYPCFFDHNGNAMVRVTLRIEDKCHTEDFMVTDFNNKAIKNPDSFAINTALKRCLVKSMAYFGLGHYIYAGEDLPPQEPEVVDTVDFSESREVLRKAFADDPKWATESLDWAKVDSVDNLSDAEVIELMKKIEGGNGDDKGKN